MDYCFQLRCFTDYNPDFYITEYGYSSPDSLRQVGPHIRDTYLLHIVLGGYCIVSGKQVTAGCAFLHLKGQVSSFKTGENYRHVWFAFDGEYAEMILSFFNIPTSKHGIFYIKNFEFLKNILPYPNDIPQSETDKDTVMSLLMSALPLLCSNDEFQKNGKNNFVSIAKQFLDTNYCHKITMQQIADYVHVTEKHLCKKFKEAYGIPPREYLLKARMKKAKMLLIKSDYLIKEIATSVGYSSQLDFSNIFKKNYGISPQNYRNKHKKSGEAAQIADEV